MHLTTDIGHQAATTKLFANVAITAVLACAGRDKVAHARQAGERRRTPAQRHAQPRQLGQPSRNNRGTGVVAGTQAITDARRNCHDILQRACEFTTHDIGMYVNAEQACRKHPLQRASDRLIGHS